MTPRILRKLALALAVLALLLGVPELVLRAFWEAPPAKRPDTGTRRFVEWLERLSIPAKDRGLLYREDAQRLWVLKPNTALDTFNYHALSVELAPPIRISVNASGYRGPAAADAQATRVVCMGDSNFFGYPLDDDDVFPVTLQRALDAREDGSFEVLNGGVPGYTVEQGLRWFRETFRALEPDVILLSYLNNDSWLQPQTDAQLLAQAGSAFAGLQRGVGSLRVIQYLLAKRSELVPGDPQRVERVPLARFLELYGEFFDEASRLGADVLVLDYRAYEVKQPYSDALRELCERRGVGYVFVFDVMRSAMGSRSFERDYPDLYGEVRERWGDEAVAQYPYLACFAEFSPEHLNEVGTRILAKRVAKLLRRGTWIPR